MVGKAQNDLDNITYYQILSCHSWRREWDSNPRYGFPHTRFPSVRLKPLGHLSGGPLLKGQDAFCKGHRAGGLNFPQTTESIRKFDPDADRDEAGRLGLEPESGYRRRPW